MVVKNEPVAGQSRTRARTRRAILDAAVLVLGQDASATMSAVAERAGVARSTLQRYFPDRESLTSALAEYATERIHEAVRSARIGDGTAAEALNRLVSEYFDTYELVFLAFTSDDDWAASADDEPDESDAALAELVERGHADGTIDPRLSPAWMGQFVWAMLYAAGMHVRSGAAAKHEALTQCLYTLRKAVAVPETS
ncbi:AcrR family transcriptional regulator [Nocardiopsis mwathae]|uniref:AcrR family transcriptional regulator n=1 Tax=Nocardiopsis mwathae TaxID=1472723 RepID=A0A7W9YKE4_9ACTN|nr:TetR/AcrR family transcriptional regulator [Nocardiopsis mwathae]MBB6172811.1 AcrR family transcriptional regulator [Nocardiopsis mwathae]